MLPIGDRKALATMKPASLFEILAIKDGNRAPVTIRKIQQSTLGSDSLGLNSTNSTYGIVYDLG